MGDLRETSGSCLKLSCILCLLVPYLSTLKKSTAHTPGKECLLYSQAVGLKLIRLT